MRRLFTVAWVAVLMTIGLAVGGTYALFASVTKVQTNTIQTGTICISSQRMTGQAVPGPMFYVTAEQGAATVNGTTYPGTYPTGLWWPGRTQIRRLVVRNDCMAAKLTGVSAVLTAGDPELAEDVTVAIDAENMESYEWEEVARVPLKDLLSSPVQLSRALQLEELGIQDLRFRITLNRSAGNRWQGETLEVTFTVIAEQARNN